MAKNIQFLRNKAPLATKSEALAKLNTVLGGQADGAPAIVSYGDDTKGYAALFGFAYSNGKTGEEKATKVQIFEGIKYTIPEGGGDLVVEVPEEVKKAIEDAISDIKGGATAGFDTLKEVEDVIKGVISGSGLNADGSYAAPTDSTYVSGTTSIVDAIDKLDEALKGVSDSASALKIAKVTNDTGNTLGATVKEVYKLVGADGKTAIGEEIIIYKDQTLKEVSYDNETQIMSFTYIMDDGQEKTETVDMKAMIQEAEIGDGLSVSTEGKVSVKLDAASETFLTVGSAGIKLAGVQAAIDTAKTTIDGYTVNGMAISGNPVVDGSNASLSSAYAVAETPGVVASGDTIDAAFGKLAKSISDLDEELNGTGATGTKVYLTKVNGSDAITVTEKSTTDNTQDISLKVKANDPMLTITVDGLQTKADFVLDAGTY